MAQGLSPKLTFSLLSVSKCAHIQAIVLICHVAPNFVAVGKNKMICQLFWYCLPYLKLVTMPL